MTAFKKFLMATALGSIASTAMADGAGANDEYRWLIYLVFGTVIALTMYITYWSAKRVQTASDFYTAGGRHFGFPKRVGDCGGLPVGRVVLRHCWINRAQWLRRLYVFSGLVDGLRVGAAADGRAVPQHRTLHLGRYFGLP